jgi:hypothetical protein
MQLLASCGQGNLRENNLTEAREQFRIQGQFLVVKIFNSILPSAYAAGELESELAISRGRIDALEAQWNSISSLNPEAPLLTDSTETFCKSVTNRYTHNSCPATKKCAFIRKIAERRSESGFACGVILEDGQQNFNFKFTITEAQAFADGVGFEVVMVDSQTGLDRAAFEPLIDDINQLRSESNDVERLLARFNVMPDGPEKNAAGDEIEDLISLIKTEIDSLETQISVHNSAKLNVVLGAMVEREHITSAINVNEEKMMEYNNYDRKPELVETHNDVWMQAIDSFITAERLLTIADWALGFGFYGEAGSWEYDSVASFVASEGKTTLDSYDFERGWGFLNLDTFSTKRYFSYDKQFHRTDESFVERKQYYEATAVQIAYEKAVGATAPVIPIDVMLAGTNSLNNNIDYELMLKYLRLESYLSHAILMGFDMTSLQELVDILAAIKPQAHTILTSVMSGSYQTTSCDWDSDVVCQEAFKQELVMNLANDYFNTFYGSLSDPYFLAPEDLRDIYGVGLVD